MYIPRPAKLLFTVDDGWKRYLEKHGDSVSQWTPLAVERMPACGTCAMGVRRYCCASPDCTHSRFFCQRCKSKACSACGMKSTGHCCKDIDELAFRVIERSYFSKTLLTRRISPRCQYRSNSDPPCQSKTDPPPLNYSNVIAFVFFWI
ncbi:transposase zinc-binding domain-containing protein [Candidatus Erwinia dacicola]